ncbi:unnamed protein product [Allacma fusca]|uniref:Large ribosomal subunit protein uL18m n=1 Tax=Allacma fusca TaxID=39272 RepID=A0A8J2NXG5_9HEXA|nr:unnamed protein product [Allacma fusca]
MLKSILRASASKTGKDLSPLQWNVTPWAKSLATTATVSQNTTSSPPNSSIVPGTIQNRNPRNLEKLRIGEKPSGWNLDNPGNCYWNKIVLEVSNKHIDAKIVHFSGQVAVRASTQEWCINKQLVSSKDNLAFEIVAKVLAHRCLQTGLLEVHSFFNEEDLQKEKIKTFVKALEDGGLTLKEPDQLMEHERVHLNYPTIQPKAWETFEELDERVFSKLGKKY